MALAAALWVSGCGVASTRTHSASMEELIRSPGTLAEGIGALESRVYEGKEKRVREDAATVGLLELGSLYGRLGKFRQSNELLEIVYSRYVAREEGPVLSLRDVGSLAAESAVTPGMGPYQLAHYEKSYLHLLKARNFILLGDLAGARVEVVRAQAVEQAIRSRVEEEQREVFRDRERRARSDQEFARFWSGLDLGSLEAQASLGPGARAELRRIAASRENAYGLTLASLVYLGLGEFQDALLDARRALEITGLGSLERYRRGLGDLVEGRDAEDLPNVFVFVSTDHAPFKRSRDLRFPNPLSGTLAKISLVSYVRRPASVARVDAVSQTLEPLADTDLLAMREYEERMPAQLTRTLIRFFLRAAKDVYLQKKLGATGQLMGSLANELLEGVDTRCWTTLPKKVYFGVLSITAREVLLEARGPAGELRCSRTLPVDPDRLNLIDLSVSSSGVHGYSTTMARPAVRWAAAVAPLARR